MRRQAREMVRGRRVSPLLCCSQTARYAAKSSERRRKGWKHPHAHTQNTPVCTGTYSRIPGPDCEEPMSSRLEENLSTPSPHTPDPRPQMPSSNPGAPLLPSWSLLSTDFLNSPLPLPWVLHPSLPNSTWLFSFWVISPPLRPCLFMTVVLSGR